MRRSRIQCQTDSNIYHVMTRGCGRRIIFEDNLDRSRYLSLLARFTRKHAVTILAWCLMDNHVHLLLEAPMASISKAMHDLGSTYSAYYNRRHGHVGHLYQGRFASQAIDSDTYLQTVLRYIHQNPVKRGISAMESYPWSSYQEYLGDPVLIDRSRALAAFGDLREMVSFHQILSDDQEDHQIDAAANGRSTSALAGATDGQLNEAAGRLLEGTTLDELGNLPREERDKKLRALKEAGMSVRKIERLTGIGRNIIGRA